MNRRVAFIALVAAVLLVGAIVFVRRDGQDAATGAIATTPSAAPTPALVGEVSADQRRAADETDATAARNVVELEPAAPSTRDVSRRRPGSIVVQIVFPDGAPAAGAAAWHVESPPWTPSEIALAQEEARRLAPISPYPGFGQRDWSNDPLARHYVADDEGRVHPLLRDAGSTLYARLEHGGNSYRGKLWIDEETKIQPGTEHRVVIEPAQVARVRVVDPAAEPVAGVLLAIVTEQGQGKWRRRFALESRTTDEEGRVALEVAMAGWPTHVVNGPQPRVVALVGSDPEPEVPLDTRAERTLVVPYTGTLAIEFAHVPSGYAAVRLAAPGDALGGTTAVVRNGRAEFARVALGAVFDAELSSVRDKATERIVGPTAERPSVVHHWQTAPPRGAFTFTLKDESGAPLADRLVAVNYHDTDGTRHRAGGDTFVTTDARGRGAMRPIVDPIGEARLRFFAHDGPHGDRGRRLLSARVTVDATQRGASHEDTELGEIVLTAARRLASGRVLARSGEPVTDADVSVIAVEPGEPEQRSTIARTQSGDDGAFVVFGDRPADRALEVHAMARGFLASEPVALELDAEVDLTLDPAASLRFGLLTEEGLERGFEPVLVLADGSRRQVPVERRRFGSQDATRSDRFLERVPAGPARLVVESVAADEPLVERDVVLENGLVDLGEIDLRHVPSFRLTVRAAEGTAPYFVTIVYEGRESSPLRDVGTRPRLVRPMPGRSITVQSPGFVPATLTVESEEVEVVLARGVPAVLRLPRGYPRPAEGTPASLSFARREGGRIEHVGTWATVTDADEYRVGLDTPGAFRVTLVLGRDRDVRFGPSADFELTAAALANGTPVELPFDLDEWTRALQAFEKR